jgi:hypothetical protein
MRPRRNVEWIMFKVQCPRVGVNNPRGALTFPSASTRGWQGRLHTYRLRSSRHTDQGAEDLRMRRGLMKCTMDRLRTKSASRQGWREVVEERQRRHLKGETFAF